MDVLGTNSSVVYVGVFSSRSTEEERETKATGYNRINESAEKGNKWREIFFNTFLVFNDV